MTLVNKKLYLVLRCQKYFQSLGTPTAFQLYAGVKTCHALSLYCFSYFDSLICGRSGAVNEGLFHWMIRYPEPQEILRHAFLPILDHVQRTDEESFLAT